MRVCGVGWGGAGTVSLILSALPRTLLPPSWHCSGKRTSIMLQIETSAALDNLAAFMSLPDVDFAFVGPGDLGFSMGLITRDTLLGFQKAPEMRWALKHIVDTSVAAGKIAGGFTRGGDPSTLLAAGFSMVSLGADCFEIVNGAQSIMTGAVSGPAGGSEKSPAPGLEATVRGWQRGRSVLIPTMGVLLTDVLPTLAWHVMSIKGPFAAPPRLNLPAVMPADLSAVADIDAQVPPAAASGQPAPEVTTKEPV